MRSWWPRVLGIAIAIAVVLAIVHCRGHEERRAKSGAGTPVVIRPARGVDPRSQPRGSIAGSVKTEAGTAIARAVVCVTPDDTVTVTLARDLPCVISDDSGRYAIDDLLPSLYTVTAMARGYAPAKHHPGGDPDRGPIELAAAGHLTGIDIVVRRKGVELRGTISDSTGGPIAHASVAAGDAHTESDAAGAYSLWLDPGDVFVDVSASGYAPRSVSATAPGLLSVTLVPESTLAGTVVDGDGAPIAGALVTAELKGDETRSSDVSDAAGHFTLVGIEPGTYEVNARAEHAYGRTDGTTTIGFAAHVTGVVVTMHPAFEISGTVMARGVPCLDAEISVEDDRSHPLPVRNGPNGLRTAYGARPATYKVTVWCHGAAPTQAISIDITDHDVTGQVWQLAAGATVAGRVVDRRGEPVAGIVVGLSGEGFGFSSEPTGADGRYTITGVPPASYQVELQRGQGKRPLAEPLVVPDRAALDHDFAFDDVGTIHGLVVDTEGRVAPRVEMFVNAPGDGSWSELVWSGDDGTFLLDGVPPGTYTISPHNSYEATHPVEVTVHGGETVQARIEMTARDGVIKGTVVDGSGAPVADAYVTDEESVVSTDGKGAFEFRSLPAHKSYGFTAYTPGGGSSRTSWAEVGDTVKLQLRVPGSIEGRLIDGPDPVTITAMGEGGSCGVTIYGTGGHYRCTGLGPGHYQVGTVIDGRYAQTEIDLAEGEAKTGVDIRIQGLTTIMGRLVDATTHAPVAGIAVRVAEPGSDVIEAGSARSGPDGRFTLADQRPGRWILTGDVDGPVPSPPVVAEELRVVGERFDAGDLPVAPRADHEYSFGFDLGYLEGVHDPGAWRSVVASVDAGGPADKAGLKAGDVIRAVNGHEVSGPHTLLMYAYLFASPAGAARLTLESGATLTITGAPPRK